MRLFLSISNDTFFVYYLLSNLIYLILLITAIFKNTIHRHRLASLKLELLKASPFTPPITLLVPAHNEESSIVESVRALLSLDYPPWKSLWSTTDRATVPGKTGAGVSTSNGSGSLHSRHCDRATARNLRSPTEPQLLVLDKEALAVRPTQSMPASTRLPALTSV